MPPFLLPILSALEDAGSFAWKHWKLIGSALVVGSLSFMLHVRTVQRNDARRNLSAEQSAHARDIATWKAAVAEAERKDAEHARQVEQQQAQVAQDTDHAYQVQIANLRSNLARWMQQHAAPRNDQSGSGISPVPGVPGPAEQLPQPATDAIVSGSDLDACAVDYSYAYGLWSAWQKMSAIKR